MRVLLLGKPMKHNMTPAQWHQHLKPILEAMDAGQHIESAESFDSTDWFDCTGKNFKIDRVYRVKQSKRFCNGVELDQSLMALDSAKVFIADPTHYTGCATVLMQTNDEVAYVAELCKLGMVYSTPEAAAIHGKAMRIVAKE